MDIYAFLIRSISSDYPNEITLTEIALLFLAQPNAKQTSLDHTWDDLSASEYCTSAQMVTVKGRGDFKVELKTSLFMWCHAVGIRA